MGKPRIAAAAAAMRDQRFLDDVRKADLLGLEAMLVHHSHRSCPRWKRVAIRRAISRHRPCTIEWVMGLDEIDTCDLPPDEKRDIAEARLRLRRDSGG